MNISNSPSFFLSLALVAAVGAGFTAGNLGNSGDSMDSGLEWQNQITIEKNSEQVDRFYNTLTDQGKKYIAGKLFNSSANNALHTSNNFTYIALGNGSDVETEHSVLKSEIKDYGLSRAKAATISSGSLGTYKLEKKFTADLSSGPDNIIINTTGLNYESTGETLISGGNFTSATLKDGDEITVTHEITIEEGSSP